MARHFITLALVLALSVLCQATTLSTFISPADRARIKTVFDSAQPYKDLQSVYYSALGRKLLGETLTNVQEICSFLKSHVDHSNVESLFFASSTSKEIGNCQLNVPPTTEKTLNEAIVEGVSVPDLYYITFASKNLGYKIDSAKVSKALNAGLKKEDSVLNLGYSFHIATLLTDPKPMFERIEDAIVQTDEVDGKYAQFEGGLSITAVVISGVYRLAEHVKKAPALDVDKCIKFANYFMSRKQVQVLRAAYHLLDVLTILTNNKFHVPVAVTLASKVAVSVAEPTVQIRVTNLLGMPLDALKVSVDRAVHSSDDNVILKQTPLLEVKSDKTLFELNFMQTKPSSGFYKIYINTVGVKDDSRLIGNKDSVVEVKVMTQVVVEGLEIGTVDMDQTTPAKLNKVEYPKTLPQKLEADYHQKLQMKFTLKNKNENANMVAHQVFVRLLNEQTKQEIVFVAEPDSSATYRFDLDVNAKAKDIGYLSGNYQLDLIVGDAVIANPFSWHVANVELEFPKTVSIQKPTQNQYAAKPEIKHVFREPEKRPSAVVSNSFTALTIAPLLLLIILWIKLGVNLSNFQFNVGTIGFHLGLSAIFGLFIVFWLNLDMFSTLKYLTLLGTVTFLCGNSMLSKIAAARK